MSPSDENTVVRSNQSSLRSLLAMVAFFSLLGSLCLGGYIYLWAPEAKPLLEFTKSNPLHLALLVVGVICFMLEAVFFIKYARLKRQT